MNNRPLPRRIPFDSLTLRAVADELRTCLIGSQVQRISQLDELEVGLAARARGNTHHIVFSADAQYARVHLMRSRPSGVEDPGPFCMALRKYIENGFVAGIEQVGCDRILRVVIRRGPATYTLVGEFMGRHSNLMLLDDGAYIRACLKQVTERQSRTRPVRPGLPYAEPPPPRGDVSWEQPEALDVLASAMGQEDIVSFLLSRVRGLSPFLATVLAYRMERMGVEQAWKVTFEGALLGEWKPVTVESVEGACLGAYPIDVSDLPGVKTVSVTRISVALDDCVQQWKQAEGIDRLRRICMAEVQAAIRAREGQLRSLDDELREAETAEQWRRFADSLLAGQAFLVLTEGGARVPDIYSPEGGQVTVPLVPGMTPQETAGAYYKRAQKLERRKTHVMDRREALARELQELREAELQIEQLRDEERLTSFREALLHRGLVRPSGEPGTGAKKEVEPASLPGVQRVITPEGYEILVGKNAEGNAALLRMAAPDDLWFHVRPGTGAHVIVRTGRKPENVPLTVIRRAAVLAARNSSAKHSSYVPVDYTQRKYVRPIRGGPPGRVTYRMHRSIDVTPEDAD